MNIDGITLHALAQEIDSLVQGARIDRITQPDKMTIVLSLRQPGRNLTLTISAEPDRPHIFVSEQTYDNPAVPPAFCMLLRKHLGGARIISIEQIDFERVICIRMENLNELGDVVQKSLMIEIMGKHSNIIFVDNKNRIVDSIKHISGMVSSVREVLPGREYFIPNTLNKQNPLSITTDIWNTELFAKPTS